MPIKQRILPTTGPAVAYSYLRFSSTEQAKGDSVRRQTESRDNWLASYPAVKLDTSLRLTDKGRSGFRRTNWDTYALAEFVRHVESGRVAPGSYLLVENLDRLSRENVGDAVELFLRIVNRGVVVVQLMPNVVEFRRPVDMISLMLATVELSRGHSESAMKSVRTTANWQSLRRGAAEGKPRTRRVDGEVTAVITRRLPGWVTEREGRMELIPARSAVVRRIFEMCAAGLGMTSIVKRLTAEGIAAFGGRERVEDGRTRKRDGDVYGCGEWRTSYVRSILTDRRALGEYQPRDSEDRPAGDPIPGYYPPVVTETEFARSRAAATGRRNKPGRIGHGVANLFGGLLVNARDGDSYYAACRSEGGRQYRVLLNKTSIEGQSRAYTFPYSTFEAAILSALKEVDPAEVLGPAAPAGEADAFRGELRWVRERKVVLAGELLKGHVSAVADAIRKLEAQEAELLEKLDEAAAEEAVPLARSLEDARTLADLLAAAPDPEDARLRLRAVLRRLVESVYLLVVPRGRYRLAEVQVNFRKGGRRNYLIVHRSAVVNQSATSPGGWAVRSFKHPDDGHGLSQEDLRDPDEAACVLGYLENYPKDMMERLVDGVPLADGLHRRPLA